MTNIEANIAINKKTESIESFNHVKRVFLSYYTKLGLKKLLSFLPHNYFGEDQQKWWKEKKLLSFNKNV